MDQQPPPPPAYPAPPPGQGHGAPPPGQGYGAPHPGQGYGAPPQGNVVVLTTPSVVRTANVFRESPVSTNCQFCHAQIVTSTAYVTGTFAWLICGILILVGLWIGCCLIPFCVNGCKDVIHTCPNCGQQVGKYNRM